MATESTSYTTDDGNEYSDEGPYYPRNPGGSGGNINYQGVPPQRRRASPPPESLPKPKKKKNDEGNNKAGHRRGHGSERNDGHGRHQAQGEKRNARVQGRGKLPGRRRVKEQPRDSVYSDDEEYDGGESTGDPGPSAGGNGGGGNGTMTAHQQPMNAGPTGLPIRTRHGQRPLMNPQNQPLSNQAPPGMPNNRPPPGMSNSGQPLPGVPNDLPPPGALDYVHPNNHILPFPAWPTAGFLPRGHLNERHMYDYNNPTRADAHVKHNREKFRYNSNESPPNKRRLYTHKEPMNDALIGKVFEGKFNRGRLVGKGPPGGQDPPSKLEEEKTQSDTPRPLKTFKPGKLKKSRRAWLDKHAPAYDEDKWECVMLQAAGNELWAMAQIHKTKKNRMACEMVDGAGGVLYVGDGETKEIYGAPAFKAQKFPVPTTIKKVKVPRETLHKLVIEVMGDGSKGKQALEVLKSLRGARGVKDRLREQSPGGRKARVRTMNDDRWADEEAGKKKDVKGKKKQGEELDKKAVLGTTMEALDATLAMQTTEESEGNGSGAAAAAAAATKAPAKGNKAMANPTVSGTRERKSRLRDAPLVQAATSSSSSSESTSGAAKKPVPPKKSRREAGSRDVRAEPAAKGDASVEKKKKKKRTTAKVDVETDG